MQATKLQDYRTTSYQTAILQDCKDYIDYKIQDCKDYIDYKMQDYRTLAKPSQPGGPIGTGGLHVIKDRYQNLQRPYCI